MAREAERREDRDLPEVDAPGPEPGAEARPFRGLLAYDGGRYHGWQAQAALATVQGEVERALHNVTGLSVRIQGAGRTDAGVHALGQVMSFALPTRLSAERLRMAMNAHLPPDIHVHFLEEAPAGFSARFSAAWRRYHYVLLRRPSPFLRGRAHVPRAWPEAARLEEAARDLPGEREFRALTTQKEGPFGCRVHEARWTRFEGGLLFTIASNRFLYQMVRIIVGTFLEIGRGRLDPASFPRILAGDDRRAAGPLAPACGLYLAEVGYDPPWPAGDENQDEQYVATSAEVIFYGPEALCLPGFLAGRGQRSWPGRYAGPKGSGRQTFPE